MRSVLPIALVALIFSICNCNGLAIHILSDPRNSKRSNGNGTLPGPTECGFVGNSDIYGIGIRVGYYTQTLSVWLANYFVLSEARLLRSINLLFLLAVFIGLIWMSHMPSQIHAIEAYILLMLLITTWHVGVLDNTRFTRKHYKSTAMTHFVRIITMSSISGYYFWFWWFGVNLMAKTPCGTFVWAVVKTSLFDWVCVLNKTIAACFLVTVFWMHLGDFIDLVRHTHSTHTIGPDYFSRLGEFLQSVLHQQNEAEAEVKDGQQRHERTPPPPIWMDILSQDVQSLESKIDNNHLGLAIHIALPPSPCIPLSSQESHIQGYCASAETTQKESSLPSPMDLLEAENFLKHILAVQLQNHSAYRVCLFRDTRWAFNIYMMKFHSPRYYWKRLCAIKAHRPLRLDILAPILSHLMHFETWRHSGIPSAIETAVTATNHKTITPLALHTILTLHAVELPTSRRPPNILLSACWSLLLCITMVLSIELSLVWNHIHGMGNLGTVGQMIPAILGSGGLVRVLWIWWSRLSVAPEEREEFEAAQGVKECVELYEQVKLQYLAN